MRYFLVVLAIFVLLAGTPATIDVGGALTPGERAAIALAAGIFLSGVHHVVYARRYVEILCLPKRDLGKRTLVATSAALRMAFGVCMLFPELRAAAVNGTMVLLVAVFPVNLQVIRPGNFHGQLIATRWFLWVRVAVHAAWIGWCGWCLTLV